MSYTKPMATAPFVPVQGYHFQHCYPLLLIFLGSLIYPYIHTLLGYVVQSHTECQSTAQYCNHGTLCAVFYEFKVWPLKLKETWSIKAQYDIWCDYDSNYKHSINNRCSNQIKSNQIMFIATTQKYTKYIHNVNRKWWVTMREVKHSLLVPRHWKSLCKNRSTSNRDRTTRNNS